MIIFSWQTRRKTYWNSGRNMVLLNTSGGASMADQEHLEVLKRGIINDNLSVLTPEGQS